MPRQWPALPPGTPQPCGRASTRPAWGVRWCRSSSSARRHPRDGGVPDSGDPLATWGARARSVPARSAKAPAFSAASRTATRAQSSSSATITSGARSTMSCARPASPRCRAAADRYLGAGADGGDQRRQRPRAVAQHYPDPAGPRIAGQRQLKSGDRVRVERPGEGQAAKSQRGCAPVQRQHLADAALHQRVELQGAVVAHPAQPSQATGHKVQSDH